MAGTGTAAGDARTRPNQREHILDVALGLMSEHGAQGMSMRRLAAACGVQVAAIYHYFASKDALVAAVVAERRYGARLSDPLPVDPTDPPEVRLRALVHFVWQGALAEQEVWRLLLGEGMRGDATVTPVGRELLDLLESAAVAWVAEVLPEADRPAEVAALLVGQLVAGFVQVVFRPELDPTAIAEASASALAAVVLPR